jgi:uncharacterized protein with HEPN domain
MTQHDDSLYLLHMFESAQKALRFVQGKTRAEYDQDEVLRLALLHLIQTIGEAAHRISKTYQDTHPEVAWKAITGIRHRIVHNYVDIDDEVIWKTVTDDLPPLLDQLRHLIPPESS